MHEDQGAAGPGGERGHAGVSTQRGDVVDDARPRFEGGFGGRRAVGVYRDDGVGPVSEYGSYSRPDPADFLFVWNGVRAGAG